MFYLLPSKKVAKLKERKNYIKMEKMRKVYDNKNYMGCVIVKYPISVCVIILKRQMSKL